MGFFLAVFRPENVTNFRNVYPTELKTTKPSVPNPRRTQFRNVFDYLDL